MGTVVVRRPLRRPAPEMPAGELVLDAPPEIPPPAGRQWTQVLMVLPMVLMMGAMILLFSGGFGGQRLVRHDPLRRVRHVRRRDAADGRRRVHERRRAQQEGDGPRPPAVPACPRPAPGSGRPHGTPAARARSGTCTRTRRRCGRWPRSYRLWERRRGDADFGVARIGLGAQTLATHADRAGHQADGAAGTVVRAGVAPVHHHLLGGAGPAARHGGQRVQPHPPARRRPRRRPGARDDRPARHPALAGRPADRGVRQPRSGAASGSG